MRHDRDPHRDQNYVPDTFWLLVAALLFAACGLVWLIGQVAAILFGAHQHLPVRLVDMLGVLLRLPGTWEDPARAWPPETWPLLPGPVGMYAAAVLTFWIPALAYGLLVRLLSPRARRRRKQRGAKWASLWQLRRLLVIGPRRGRIILGRRDRIRDRLLGRLYLAVEQCHSVLAFGPPGSFKTHGLVIPAILEWQGNLVTTSIKPDVLRATCAHRANLGAVWVYDPLGLSGVPAAQWTPLAECRSYGDARRIGRMLAEAAEVHGHRAEDANYWQLLGAKLLSVLLFAAAGTGRSMADVARWVDVQDVDEVAQALMEIGNQQALDAWAACTSRPENTLGSVYGTAETLLDVYGDPVIAASAEGCDLDLDELLTGANNTLYLYAPASEQERLRSLFELLVSVVIFKAEQLAAAQPGGMLDPRLFVCLDEAGNCAAINKLPQLATTGRGQGIQLLTIWHDEAQLQHRYGHRASTVLNGHRAKLLLSGQADPASLELASKLVGDEAAMQTSETIGGDGQASLTDSTAYRRLLPPDPPESAAGHLLRVAPQADPFVVSTLRQAAERSLAQGAADVAVGYLTRALEEQLDPAARAEVLVELGLGERRTNGPAAADHLRAGLELLADPGRRGEVALELGRALWFTDRIADALAVIERALGEVDRERDPDLHELLVAELISSAWWNPQTYPIAEAAIGELDLDALHGGLGSEILLATIAIYEFRLALHRELTVELARRALASGNLLASNPIAFLYAVVTLFRSGVLDEAVAIFNQAVAQARRRGDIFNLAFLLTWRGVCQTERGDLRAAVADLREAIELSVAHGTRLNWPYNIGFLAYALLEQGDADEAARVIDRGGFPEQLPLDQVHLVWFRLHRARVRIETGSPERGVEVLRQVGQTVRLLPFDNPGTAPWRSWAAEGLRRLDRHDEARVLAADELTLARRWGDPHAIGAALRVLGLVAGGTAGIGLLREAVEVLAGSQARLQYARALVDLGAALRRANQRTEARERLREGVDLAQRLGAFGLAGRANDEIAATGARPRKVFQTGLDALTASERRVGQLAADGMSNKEIAQTLFVTIKTVEVHLSHAYRKLEISSRAQLQDALLTPAPNSASASA